MKKLGVIVLTLLIVAGLALVVASDENNESYASDTLNVIIDIPKHAILVFTQDNLQITLDTDDFPEGIEEGFDDIESDSVPVNYAANFDMNITAESVGFDGGSEHILDDMVVYQYCKDGDFDEDLDGSSFNASTAPAEPIYSPERGGGTFYLRALISSANEDAWHAVAAGDYTDEITLTIEAQD